ncbi:pectate lyase [Ketobacter sp. MCCC 1A13808]|uniref:pectate lyase n=1 Tax=Ketobacter sp. MCCC 1A13808 TaxID=2602738 RepID=UPI0012EBAA22|nr:pectate lyase [Ketobacter sp. MCCC 1A13808]MVF11590.1 pectate lyase [Ketobacter sp. MCCC 1A13808]
MSQTNLKTLLLLTTCISFPALAFTPTPDPGPDPETPSTSIANGRYVLYNQNSGKAMTVAGGSKEDGANVIQQDYSGQDYQQWDVSSLGSGYYSIRPAHSGKSLDVWEWNASDGADARQWTYLSGENQQWQISSTGNGAYSIISRYSGKAIETFENSTANGANIDLWNYWGGPAQQWKFTLASAAGGGNGGGDGGNNGNTKGATCTANGSVTVTETIVVSGGVYDGGCKVFNPTSALGDGGQAEGQKPVFRVENGATLKNVIIGKNGADGIHFYNGGTIDNIRWTDVGEDALTVKSKGDVTIRNITGVNGYDKFMQINAETNLNVSNCVVDNMGKFLRQNGGTGFTINVNVTNCDISNMKEAVFRTDSPTSTARITNSRLRNAGQLCYGSWKSCTSSNITSF